MGRVVIACYRPKEGKAEALRELSKTHWARLKAEALVTDRVPITMVAEDGTIVEVFEWKSKEAIEAAHKNPRVLEMWEEFGEVCDYVPIGTVAEAETVFSQFGSVEVEA